MQVYTKIRLILLGSLCLLLLLSSTAMMQARQSIERNQADEQTVLTLQTQRALPSGAEALITARLTTSQGEPVANAEITLMSSVTPTQQASTDGEGIANFRLTPTTELNGYHLKAIFGGKPGYHATIALTTFDNEKFGDEKFISSPTVNGTITPQRTERNSKNTIQLVNQPSNTPIPKPTTIQPTPTRNNEQAETPTVITTQPEIRTQPNEEPIVIALLTTAQGEPIADAEVVLFVETTPALHVRTNSSGISTFRLPPGLAAGDHDLKIVFAGKDQYQAALSMTTLHYHTEAPGLLANQSNSTEQAPQH